MKLSLADLVMGSIGKACVDHKTFLKFSGLKVRSNFVRHLSDFTHKTKIISFLSFMWKICHLGPNFTKISLWKLKGQFFCFFFIFQVPPTILKVHSCGTVALYGPFYLFFFADHRATVFTLSKTFETVPKKSCAAFLPIFIMKSGARTIKHIYFVSLDIYLHSSILTYLLIFISSSLS